MTLKEKTSWVLVAHSCNPSYSGGRDQKDHSSKPTLAYSSRDPISEISITFSLSLSLSLYLSIYLSVSHTQ
jgi:hypothetical protein